MLYFAYGSNLNKQQMSIRCPKAKALGAAYIVGWRLVFRGVADIERTNDPSAMLPVGFWDSVGRRRGILSGKGKIVYGIV